MSSTIQIIAVLGMTIVAPLLIITNFIAKMRATRGLSIEDEKLLADLWEGSKRMEERIYSLERILDSDQPSWRNRP